MTTTTTTTATTEFQKVAEKLAKIISSTSDETLRIKAVESAFKAVGFSGAKMILEDAKDFSERLISQSEFEYRLKQCGV